MVKKWIKDQKLRDKSIPVLLDRVKELKASQFTNRFQKSTGKLENFNLIGQTRRRLAAVLTIIGEKQAELDAVAQSTEVQS